jgi:uncharacterized protein (TIGR03382 family)
MTAQSTRAPLITIFTLVAVLAPAVAARADVIAEPSPAKLACQGKKAGEGCGSGRCVAEGYCQSGGACAGHAWALACTFAGCHWSESLYCTPEHAGSSSQITPVPGGCSAAAPSGVWLSLLALLALRRRRR